jgi:hypothetical protein
MKISSIKNVTIVTDKVDLSNYRKLSTKEFKYYPEILRKAIVSSINFSEAIDKGGIKVGRTILGGSAMNVLISKDCTHALWRDKNDTLQIKVSFTDDFVDAKAKSYLDFIEKNKSLLNVTGTLVLFTEYNTGDVYTQFVSCASVEDGAITSWHLINGSSNAKSIIESNFFAEGDMSNEQYQNLVKGSRLSYEIVKYNVKHDFMIKLIKNERWEIECYRVIDNKPVMVDCAIAMDHFKEFVDNSDELSIFKVAMGNI